MNRTLLLFLYSFLLMILFPQLPILFFAPFIVINYYKKNLINCLWFSFLCGIIMDLFSDTYRLGIFPLSYCLTTFFLYFQKDLFFEDRFNTPLIMTALFSALSTLINTSIIYFLTKTQFPSWKWVESDLFWMPLADSIYTLIAFSLPSLFIPKASSKRTRLFSMKNEAHE
jgi:hypothetical protein